MKKVYLVFFLFLALNAPAQLNLVPNPSFEDYSSCPTFSSQLNVVAPWFSPTWGSPDYFNSCSSASSGVKVPDNSFGYQYANTGDGYCGIVVYCPYPCMREYLECQLSSVLLLNHKYCVELKLSLGDKSPFAVSNIGVYFSADSVNSGFTAELNFTPQVLNPTGAYLSDTSNWMTVSGAFVATGSEKFIVIGNFEPSISTDTISVPVNSGASPFAYYYVDDVSIKECSTESVPNTFTPNNDGQNDFVDFSGYTLVEQIVTIYDRWGLKVFESSESNTKWDGKDLKGNDCTDGVYYYLFHYADFINTDYNSLDRKGFIQLIR